MLEVNGREFEAGVIERFYILLLWCCIPTFLLILKVHLSCAPHIFYIEVLTHCISECALTWKQGHCWYNLLKWGHIGIGWASNLIWLVSLLKWKTWTKTHTERENAMWSLALCHKPRNAQNFPQSEAKPETWNDPFSGTPGGSIVLWLYSSQTSLLQNCNTISSCSLKHSACVTLLQQP